MTPPLVITLLGTGTSTGIPVIGCACAVCTSDDPRNRRLRCSAYLEYDGHGVLIDTSTDLRQQALRFGVSRVDAVLYTHPHADHLHGLDELRSFNQLQKTTIPCYGSAMTLEALRRRFDYIFEVTQEGGGKPRLELVPVKGSFELLGRRIVPIPIFHGEMPIYGYRLGSFAYLTDCSRIPAESYALLEGLEVLVLDALHYNPHPTHFTVQEAVAEAQRIGAERTYFVHMNHKVDHGLPAVPLPDGIEFAHDGLRFELA